jgi:hypothetical protein
MRESIAKGLRRSIQRIPARMPFAGRTRIVLSLLIALVLVTGIALFALRPRLERTYALHALRSATGLNIQAERIDRSGSNYIVHGLVAWTHGGAFLVDAPLARIELGRGSPVVELAQPRFVVAPERLRENERTVLRAGTLRFADGTLSVVAGEIPEPIVAFDRFSCDITKAARVRYDAHIELLAAGGRFPIDGHSVVGADGNAIGSWHAAQVPIASLGAFVPAAAPLRPIGGWLRDVDVVTGASWHANARLEDADFSLGRHALAALHGSLVLEGRALGTRDVAGTLDDVPLSVAGEVHDLPSDASWLRNGSRDLSALARLLAAIAKTPELRRVRLEATAPGLAFAQLAFTTVRGPLAISVLAIDPSEPTLRFDTALAQDHVISGGERTSALGLRTGAIAGVNGDYFDIGRTYQPQGMLLRDGLLERGPTDRAALVIDRTKHVTFAEFHLRGEVRTPRGTMTISELNDWPPGNVAVITSAFGTKLPASPGRTFVSLEPAGGGDHRYRVTDVAAMTEPRNVRFGIAIGPLVRIPLPRRGDIVDVRYDLEPHVANPVAGIGGGPRLLRDGRWYDDPHAPAPDERNVRWPVIALATQADGNLLMVALDGRHPERSIGATRPEFAVVLQRLGAVDAMALDSGGSVTLVDRAIGDANVSVRNVPSDFSAERWISDALFLYSSAAPPSIVPPTGAPTPVPEVRPTP